MKKTLLLLFQLTLFLFTLVFLSDKGECQDNNPLKNDTVHLKVDMSFMVSSGNFHPLTDTLIMEGSMLDTTKIMEFTGSGYVYKLSFFLPVNGLYTYRFIIKTPDTSHTYYYDSADVSTRTFRVKDTTQTIFNYWNNYNPGWIPMVFDCDMYYQIRTGKFSPAIDYLDVSGNFNNWGEDRIELFPRSADSVYSFTLYFNTASIPVEAFKFKFRFNGDTATMELKGEPDRVYYMTPATNHYFCWYNDLDPNVPALPFVYNVTIHDSIYSKHTVSGSYQYEDHNLKPEGKSIYQWYTASEPGGTLTPIDSAWYINYTIDSLLIGKYLVFEVTPVTTDSIVGLPVQAWSPARIFGVGINEKDFPFARIYPNPVQDVMKIEFLRPVKLIEIMNILGQQVFYSRIDRQDKIHVDVQSLHKGIYILKLIDFENSARLYKFIKE